MLAIKSRNHSRRSSGVAFIRQLGCVAALLLSLACNASVHDAKRHAQARSATAVTTPRNGQVQPEITREQMFGLLTTHTWCTEPLLAHTNSAPPQMSVESQVVLLRDGRYNVFLSDDEIEAPDELAPGGSWNFAKTGAREGVLYLGTADRQVRRIVTFYFLSDNQLEVNGAFSNRGLMTYLRCQPVATTGADTSAELPLIDLGDDLKKLAGRTWRVVSDVAPTGTPSELHVERDGTVLVTVPSSECDDRTRSTRYYGRIVEHLLGGACRKRAPYDPTSFTSSGKFLTHLRQPYLPASNGSPERYLLLPFEDGSGLEGVVAYAPPLRKSPRPFRIELWDVRSEREVSGTLTITEDLATSTGRESRSLVVVPVRGVIGPQQSVVREIVIDSFPKTPAWLTFTYQPENAREPQRVRHYSP